MRVELAVLCDAATIRDDLLHVLGAGITGIALPEFPERLDLRLAVRVVLDRDELRDEHTLHVRLVPPDGPEPEPIRLSFYAKQPPDHLRQGAIATPVDLHEFEIHEPGDHVFYVSLDDYQIARLPLRAERRT